MTRRASGNKKVTVPPGMTEVQLWDNFDRAAEKLTERTGGPPIESMRDLVIKARDHYFEDRLTRKKKRGPNPEQLQVFLVSIASGLSIWQAAQVAGITPTMAHEIRIVDDEFRQHWEIAYEISVDEIDQILLDIARRSKNDMARVKAAEAVAGARSVRYSKQPRQSRAQLKLARDQEGNQSLTASVGWDAGE